MPMDLDAKRKAARAKALEGLAEDGLLDDQVTDVASAPDNPQLDHQFWQRAEPLDAERLKRMGGGGVKRRPKVPAEGE